MKKVLYAIGVLIVMVIILQISGISILHCILSQQDIMPRELNSPSIDKKVLIASRGSDFKNAVIDKILTGLTDDSVYIKCIGIKTLKNQDIGKFSATVIINTCMAGSMDMIVKSFIKRHTDNESIIIFTTSGNGDWLPKTNGYKFEAVSSASQKSKAGPMANEIIEKIRFRLHKYNLSF